MAGGFHDAGPEEAAKWRFVRRRGDAVLQAHGYCEAQPSPREPGGTAARAGIGSPITLPDGSELRTDPVASIARAWVAAGEPDRFARWSAAGFTFDDDDAGPFRFRAWHALAGLVLGVAEPAADAEIAALLATFAADVGVRGAEIVVGSVGEPADLQRYLAAIAELDGLRCAACRAQPAPLRFLSCEDEGCRALTQAAPPIRGYLSVPALKHHEALLATLEASGFQVRDEPRLGFGAGRYNRTLVELRGQTAEGGTLVLARGGRRDALVEALGGRPTPAVGVTFGVARIAACVPGDGDSYETPCEVYIATRGAGARAWALRAAAAERSRGFRVDVDLRDVGWADQLKRAERVRARVVIVAGDVERKKGELAIRDMRTRETRHIPEETLTAELKRLLR